VEALFPAILRHLLDHWPDRKGIYYNVNFPPVPLEKIKGVRFTRQGAGHWIREFETWDESRLEQLGLTNQFLWQQHRVELEEGEQAFFMKGDFVSDDEDPSSADHLLVDQGWITVVPFCADLTDYRELKRLQSL